jgi:ATP-binding cassette subfamily B protein
MGLYTNLAVARVSLGRVHEILEVAPEVAESPEARPLGPAGGELRFEGVCLSFGERGEILRGIDFEVAPGETVAIVGASGCGKSTIADLAVRLLDPDAGRVALDGHDLRELRLADVRRAVALVDHSAIVFHATLADNVRYACPEAGAAQVEEAVARAGLGTLVERLPQGLDTSVGEAGLALSAGERQRLAIARALLADPAVLILDEATATLDPAAEHWVLRDLETLLERRTSVLITHRLDLARRADRILLVERGRIVESGAPSQLQQAGSRTHAFFEVGVAPDRHAHPSPDSPRPTP